MCGICGVYLFDRERTVSDLDLRRMRETMVHRGPDGAGSLLMGHVGLGHRRLSIVDLAGGQQPMGNEDGSIQIVLNGEIYNHRELRNWLIPKGHQFATVSDTEAIIHLYEELGHRGIDRLKGMFAYALYDSRQDRLVLARDRFGIKPLYYYRSPEGLVFGSEIKALLACPGVPREVNWNRVADFFHYGSVYGEETLFHGIRELLPGHILVASGRKVEVECYWDLPMTGDLRGDEHEQRERAKELLKAAIQRHLMSDVPLGVFLSGGIDSSLIVAMMSEMVNEPIKTFAVGFAEEGFNEFPYSRLVASKFGTDHFEVELRSDRFFDALPDLVWHYDEPISLPASVPLYFLSREAKAKATVVLTGEGADELFLGYAQYSVMERQARLAMWFQRLSPARIRETLVKAAQALTGKNRKLLERLPMAPEALAASFIEWIPREVAFELCAPGRGSMSDRSPVEDVAESFFRSRAGSRDFLSRVTYMDFKAFLITLLMKQDKMSMAASIESRVPFLDHDLVEYCYRIPTSMKVSGTTAKKILKDIASDYFPPDFIHRRKQGFPVPVIPWLEKPSTRVRFEEVLLDPRTCARKIFDQRVIEHTLGQFKKGERVASRSDAYFIWSLVNFELWQRVFLDHDPASAISRASLTVPVDVLKVQG